MNKLNTAVLVIDDEEVVRNDIEEILAPKKSQPYHSDMDTAADILLNRPESKSKSSISVIPDFTVDKASSGLEGLELVKKSLLAKHPYAVIFLDVRMPGWDGLETAMQIRRYDSKAEIIFITAYSDHSIEDIIKQVGPNVGYHCKPYTSEEIILLATKAISDYDRLRHMERLIASISSIGLNQFQFDHLLENILYHMTDLLDADTALMRRMQDDLTYEDLLSIGASDQINVDAVNKQLTKSLNKSDDVIQIKDILLAKMDKYTGVVLLKTSEKLETEKMYVLKLFVQSASQIIRNSELNEALIQKEKLSVVGKAVGMVMHDLRGPINSMKQIIELMREENNESEMLTLLNQCTEQASEIFDDFLDFIKESPAKKAAVHLSEAADAAIEVTERRFGKNSFTIRQKIPKGLVVLGDESKLKRILLNLINNAAEALLQKKTPHPAISVVAGLSTQPGKVYITVSDNGPGIPKEIQKTLFEPFVTQNKSNGTGLGLAIVKQYIEAHEASIEVTNDKGAVFKISGLKIFKK